MSKMEKRRARTTIGALLLASFAVGACQEDNPSAAAGEPGEWPTRPVNIIVYSSAGGATDLANRAIAEGMKDNLGVDVVASNMPGALGGTAVNYVWNQRHDGYQMVGLSEGALGHSVLGLHTSTAKDWEYFMVGGTPGVISVSADSEYQTFAELYAAIQSGPGELKIATSVPGCIWNVQWLLAKEKGKFNTRYVPYAGSYPSQTAALSGEVDIVWTGLGEQVEFIKGGKLRALAVFAKQSVEVAGVVIPSIADTVPELLDSMPIDQFVGFALPADTPQRILDDVTQSFVAAMESQAVQQFGVAKHSELYGLHGERAKKMAVEQEKVFAWTLWNAGLAKKNPTELGIDMP